MKKYALILSAMLLCACGTKKEAVPTDTLEAETETAVESAEITLAETTLSADVTSVQSEKALLTICGEMYEPDTESLVIDMSSVKEHELDSLSEFTKVTELSVYNAEDHDLDFIKKFDGLEYLYVTGCQGTDNVVSAIADNSSLFSLAVEDTEFSDYNSYNLFKSANCNSVVYMQPSANPEAEENVKFYFSVSPAVYTDSGEIELVFTNETDKTGYVEIQSISVWFGDDLETIYTPDGTQEKIEVPWGASVGAALSFSEIGLEHPITGRYRISCTFSREGEGNAFEQVRDFYVTTPFISDIPQEIYCDYRPDANYYFYKTPDFLSDEQLEVFKKAYILENAFYGTDSELSQQYADTHSTEEFIAQFTDVFTEEYAYNKALGTYLDENGRLKPTSASSGVDISLWGMEFIPIQSNSSEVIFKAQTVHSYEDEPRYIWYNERKFHMINTEDGWKFDCFGLWY